jgi:hypothetical protein
MAYAEVVVSSTQASSQSASISVLDLIPLRAGEAAAPIVTNDTEICNTVTRHSVHSLASVVALARQ